MRLTILNVLFCCFFSLSLSSFASNLPPEHESARLLLVIEESVNKGDWVGADKSLTQIADLNVELPIPFFFYNGLVHSKLERLQKAQTSLEHYVVKAGTSGAFYYEALRVLTSLEHQVEMAAQADSVPQEGSDAPLPVLEGEGRDAYIQTLKALFLTDSAVQALSMQVNSLLSAHPFTGDRLKKQSEKQGTKFQISIQGNQIILQETNYQEGFPRLSASRLEVSGVDPFIRSQCNSKIMSCWLYHPTNSHEPWLKIDHDEVVVKELSQALTRLIQLLQKH